MACFRLLSLAFTGKLCAFADLSPEPGISSYVYQATLRAEWLLAARKELNDYLASNEDRKTEDPDDCRLVAPPYDELADMEDEARKNRRTS